MAIDYVGVPDWCGEAANRSRLEEWYARFGPGGVPCPVCDVSKLKADFRRLAQHLAAGRESVQLNPAKPGARREWAVSLLGSPAALVDGVRSQEVAIVDLRLTCKQCCTVLAFDAKRIGIAV